MAESDIPFDRTNPELYEDLGNGMFLRRVGAPYTEEEEDILYRKMGGCVAFTRRESSPPPLPHPTPPETPEGQSSLP